MSGQVGHGMGIWEAKHGPLRMVGEDIYGSCWLCVTTAPVGPPMCAAVRLELASEADGQEEDLGTAQRRARHALAHWELVSLSFVGPT